MLLPRTVEDRALLSNTRCRPCPRQNRPLRFLRGARVVFARDSSEFFRRAQKSFRARGRDRNRSASNRPSTREVAWSRTLLFIPSAAAVRGETSSGPLAFLHTRSKA